VKLTPSELRDTDEHICNPSAWKDNFKFTTNPENWTVLTMMKKSQFQNELAFHNSRRKNVEIETSEASASPRPPATPNPRAIWNLNSFCKRVSHKLWQPSKLKLNGAKLTLASSSNPKPTLINNWIDINTSQMMNKPQYWIDLNCVKLFYKIPNW